MKQEMRDTMMPQSGIEQLRSVFRRAGHHKVLRQQVDLQHVQEPRQSGLVIEREVRLGAAQREADCAFLAWPARLVGMQADLLTPAPEIEPAFPPRVMVLVRVEVIETGSLAYPAVLEQEVLFRPGGMRAAGHGIEMDADFEVVLLQLAVEVTRVAAGIEQQPGGLNLAPPHHLQQDGGFRRVVPIGIVRNEPHPIERPRPIIKHGQQQPLLLGEVEEAAQDKFPQLVAYRLEEDCAVIRRGWRPVPLPVEHQAIFGFQGAFIDQRGAIRRRLAILQDAHALLNVDNREDQVGPEQQRAALAEAVLQNGTTAGNMVANFGVGQRGGRARHEGITAKHVQGTAQSASHRVVAGT